MTSARISFSILMTLILASCGDMGSSRMTDRNAVQRTQERPDTASMVAPATRDVDSKGGLAQHR